MLILIRNMKRNNKNIKIKLLKRDTYLAMIKNACGSLLWRNNYALVDKKKEDIVHNGATSCAFFVSSILKIFDLIKDVHLTVKGLERDLKRSGWISVSLSSKIPKGSVLIWEEKGGHFHSGFYLGNKKAVSIWTYHNFPIIHHWTYQDNRKIIKAYVNTKFLQ